MLNKITNTGRDFRNLIRYLFEDAETVDERGGKHDLTKTTQVAFVELDGHIEELCGPLGINPAELEGHWMADISCSYSNGAHWEEVSEIVRCREVTETKIVTTWKPVEDETAKESVPAACHASVRKQ